MDDIAPADFYTGLVAELYAPLRSSVVDPEPYARFVEWSGQPALELGCGHGEPLVDLRLRGLDVEGLDSSPDMLERARRAAEVAGVDVVLHHAPMESMDLGRRYRTIFLAGPTFNLIADDATARRALERIGAHLDDDGRALIPLFVPERTPPAELGIARAAVDASGARISCTTVAEQWDEQRRVQVTTLRYEADRPDGPEVLERRWTLHWYTRESFRELATASGLAVESEREHGPDAWSVILRRAPAPPS